MCARKSPNHGPDFSHRVLPIVPMAPVAMAVEARSAVIGVRAAVIGRAIVARPVVAVAGAVIARAIGVAGPGRGRQAGADYASREAEPNARTPAPAARLGLGRCGDGGSAKRCDGRQGY